METYGLRILKQIFPLVTLFIYAFEAQAQSPNTDLVEEYYESFRNPQESALMKIMKIDQISQRASLTPEDQREILSSIEDHIENQPVASFDLLVHIQSSWEKLPEEQKVQFQEPQKVFSILPQDQQVHIQQVWMERSLQHLSSTIYGVSATFATTYMYAQKSIKLVSKVNVALTPVKAHPIVFFGSLVVGLVVEKGVSSVIDWKYERSLRKKTKNCLKNYQKNNTLNSFDKSQKCVRHLLQLIAFYDQDIFESLEEHQELLQKNNETQEGSPTPLKYEDWNLSPREEDWILISQENEVPTSLPYTSFSLALYGIQKLGQEHDSISNLYMDPLYSYVDLRKNFKGYFQMMK